MQPPGAPQLGLHAACRCLPAAACRQRAAAAAAAASLPWARLISITVPDWPAAGPGGQGGDCRDEEGSAAQGRQVRTCSLSCSCCCRRCHRQRSGSSLPRLHCAAPPACLPPAPCAVKVVQPATPLHQRLLLLHSTLSPCRSVIKFDRNSCVLVNAKGLPIGTRVLGFVTHELRARQMMKVGGCAGCGWVWMGGEVGGWVLLCAVCLPVEPHVLQARRCVRDELTEVHARAVCGGDPISPNACPPAGAVPGGTRLLSKPAGAASASPGLAAAAALYSLAIATGNQCSSGSSSHHPAAALTAATFST